MANSETVAMNEHIRQSWERFLNPETLRSNLIVASIFLAAYEILRQSIIERIRDFYIKGFDSSGFTVDPGNALRLRREQL